MAQYYDVNMIEQFIRSEAAKRGIDPDIAVRVARSEGLAPNTWQSRIKGGSDQLVGGREASYGPFQLYTGGLGAAYEKATGHEVEDPRYVKDQVRFALDQAQSGGWGPWHGWKGNDWAGITRGSTEGRGGYGGDQPRHVGGAGSQSGNYNLGDGLISALRHVGGAGSGAGYFNTGGDFQGEPDPQGTGEGPEVVADDGTTDPIGDLLGPELEGKDSKKSLAGLMDMMKPQPLMDVPDLRSGGGGSPNVQSLPEYVAQFMASRRAGGGGGQALG